MSNLYIVESPFQLICALEAKYAFPGNRHILFIRYSSEKSNNDQIERLLALSAWDEIIPVYQRKYSTFTFIDILKKLREFSLRDEIFSNIFLSFYGPGYQRYFLANTRKNKVYLFDDGYYTLEIQRDYLSRSNPYTFKDSFLRKLMMRGLGLKFIDSDVINLFTCFDIEPIVNQSVVKHDFGYLKSIMVQNKMRTDSRVYLLGGNWIEADYLSREYYLELINRIAQYFHPKEIVYLPHRREASENVSSIASLPGITVERFENPVEVEFILRGISPTHIASCFSTALFTLKSIHSDAQIHIIRLDDTEIKLPFRKRVREFYEFSEKTFESICL
jgi:hypothetical protein